jgi:predicted transcriptional regulator
VVTCIECGFKGKMLKRHLMTDHGLAPAEYRARWNLPGHHPLVAPDYAAKRAELARAIGLGRTADAPVAAKGGRKTLKVAIPAPEAE